MNNKEVWSSVTKTLSILCKPSKEFIISKTNLEHWNDSVEPITWLLHYLVCSYSISLLGITSTGPACVSPRSSMSLAKCKEHWTAWQAYLHTWQMSNQTDPKKSYLENMETYRTTLAIFAVLTEGNFHTAFSWSCRNGEGKAGIDMEGGEVPATSSTLPVFPASTQLHRLPFTCWEFFTEGSICGWWF